MSFLQLYQITKSYGNGPSATRALCSVSYTIEAGEFVAVMGESGAGKSTLLSIMGAMNRPSSGTYLVDDIDVYQLSIEQQADFRRAYLGFVFQSFHLVPYLNVVENVMLPLATQKDSRQAKRRQAIEALAWVRLEDKAFRLPGQISGGEKERVAVARAIVNQPAVLLADEPTGNLDSHNSQEVMHLLGRLHAGGTTVIMVTHSTACADHARRILEIRDGRLNTDKRQPHDVPKATVAA